MDTADQPVGHKMKPIFLSHVGATFAVNGRGVAIDPGVPYEPMTHHVLIGDDLEIRRADGSTLFTKVAGLEIGGLPGKRSCAIILPPNVSEEEVPVGSEVWQVPRRSPLT
jgi:hypothetical protein